LSGVTIAAALDALVALDPRYAWRALDGVIVVRPVQAWGDREHFLHRVLPRLSVADAHLGAALHDWTAALFPQSRLVSDELRSAPMRTAEGNRTFSFAVSDTPAILALDELARAHGAVRWEVRYCTQVVHPRVATVWLWTLEDDPTGMGKPMPGRFSTVDGKRVDACQGKM
jgi:hypothetical protein